MNTIAYLVYGGKREYQLELSYSVASAQRFIKDDPNWQLLLITDAPNKRPDLPLRHLLFDEAQFAHWTRGGTYNHAAKVEAIASAARQHAGKIALVDTDTFFKAHPSGLFDKILPGHTVMHAEDGRLGQFDYWLPLIAAAGGASHGYAVGPESMMFNSGVVGFHTDDAHLLSRVLPLMRSLYELEPVFNIEQFAFSAVFDKHTRLSVCPETVAHYWGPERRFMHAQIGELFPTFTAEVFEANVSRLSAIGYPPKKLRDQIRARLKALWRAQDGDYRFAYLAYRSALSTASAEPVHANAWALIAVDALSRRQYPGHTVARDFRHLRDVRKCPWMNDRTRSAWESFWRTHLAA